jgi:hypothetical protein
MEQRPLRLGDIVDDYCPRERRLTNHAIVAVVDNNIRQTRCTTCDAEHVYKQGREPRRRPKAGETLYEQVLADLTGGQLVAPKDPGAEAGDAAEGTASETALNPAAVAPPVVPVAAGAASTPSGDAEAQSDPADADAKADAWLAHRRLIRAALPKIDGELPPPRAIPEFTMHQRPQGRGGRPFRFGGGGSGGGGSERNGNVAHPRDSRPYQNGSSNGSGVSRPDGQGPNPGRPGGGGRRRHRRKRPRP